MTDSEPLEWCGKTTEPPKDWDDTEWDYVLVAQKKETNNPKNPFTTFNEYFISIDMAKEICMIQRSDCGQHNSAGKGLRDSV